MVLHQDFSDNPHLRLLDVKQRNPVKVPDNPPDIALELSESEVFHIDPGDFVPGLIQPIDAARFLFIRPCGIDKTHKKIPVEHGI